MYHYDRRLGQWSHILYLDVVHQMYSLQLGCSSTNSSMHVFCTLPGIELGAGVSGRVWDNSHSNVGRTFYIHC